MTASGMAFAVTWPQPWRRGWPVMLRWRWRRRCSVKPASPTSPSPWGGVGQHDCGLRTCLRRELRCRQPRPGTFSRSRSREIVDQNVADSPGRPPGSGPPARRLSAARGPGPAWAGRRSRRRCCAAAGRRTAALPPCGHLPAGRRVVEDVGHAEVGEVPAGDDDHAGQDVEGLGLMLGPRLGAGGPGQRTWRPGCAAGTAHRRRAGHRLPDSRRRAAPPAAR